MTSDNAALVRTFCDAFARRDPDEILGFFTEDAIYHNMPMPPMTGKPAIRSVLDMFLKPAQSAEFEIVNLSESGGIVLTERIDRFDIADKKIELPVMGAFEIKDGKIAAWRDYFDMATWTRQTGQGG
jgi:limonene-1,2-epoxide hydrolase